MRLRIASTLPAIVLAVITCAAPAAHRALLAQPEVEVAELWQEPVDLLERDLFTGPGGPSLAPPPDGRFEFVAFKTTGTNPGYDVRDATGRMWSVKLGIEAQSEVTASRILWALGFHQPVTYYLPQFTLTSGDAGIKSAARFRTDLDSWKPAGEWSWYDNPFADTPEFRGLIVAQLLLNNWDLKTQNNRVYEAVDPDMRPRRHFVVRDVGSSLGHSRQFILFNMLGTRGWQGSKNDLYDFEHQGFIKRVDGDKVVFDYRGINQPLIDRVTIADVLWACERFARIPDGHWRAAFRAGGYTPGATERYIKKIKQKVEEGLGLKGRITNSE